MSSFKYIFSFMPKWQGGLSELSNNLNIFIKSSWILMLLGYLSSFDSSISHNLVILPGEFFPPNFKIWTILTHAFVEMHIWNLISNIFILYLYYQLLAPLWGMFEMLKFMLLNTFLSAFVTTVFYMVYYFFFDKLDLIFAVPIYGFSASIAGFSIALKQIMCEKVFFTFQGLKLQNKHIPFLLFLSVTFLYIVRLVNFNFFILFFWGLIFSWLYLRFYQFHGNNNYGDAAESFAFASFFPDPIQPFIKVPCNHLYNFFTCLGCCSYPNKPNLVTLSNLNTSTPLPLRINVPKNETSTDTFKDNLQNQQQDKETAKQATTQHPNINIKEALSKNLITFKIVNTKS